MSTRKPSDAPRRGGSLSAFKAARDTSGRESSARAPSRPAPRDDAAAPAPRRGAGLPPPAQARGDRPVRENRQERPERGEWENRPPRDSRPAGDSRPQRDGRPSHDNRPPGDNRASGDSRGGWEPRGGQDASRGRPARGNDRGNDRGRDDRNGRGGNDRNHGGGHRGGDAHRNDRAGASRGGPSQSGRAAMPPARGAWTAPRNVDAAEQRDFASRDAAPQDARPAAPQRPRLAPAAWRLEQLRDVLESVLTWEYPADASLSHWLRAHPKLGVRDRAELAEAVYDILRNLRRYRQFGESGVGHAVRRLAILGLYNTGNAEAVKAVLTPPEQEWLARVTSIDLNTLPPAVRDSLPDWLDERLALLPDAQPLRESLNQQADLDLRVNPMKAERDEMLAALVKGMPQHNPRPTPYSPWGIRMSGRPPLNRWPQFEHGLIEVQDEGSQLLAALVAPKRGEMVIDFCAGAGGKTLLLGALMRSTGRLYAFDVSAARLARGKPRLARSGLSNVVPVAIDGENDVRVKRLAGKAQRVLVDAPCSGMGTLRRNPDLKWRQSVQALHELCALQKRILESASRCVAPGGRLIYATCSLLPEENEEQVRAFLARHPEFVQRDAGEILAARAPDLTLDGPFLKLRPDVHGTDGFFAAVLERVKPASGKGAAEAAAGVAAAAQAEAVIEAASAAASETLGEEARDGETADAEPGETPDEATPVADAGEQPDTAPRDA
ncbi:Ribosomal RNA small subunit methyltransferase B [plant metagenome]|uniref:Ribosomal RNA small subunit methyltransferase B n=1 Tax=plant metagenome TaxID=1297885 RepID=A0A484PFC0_9ZZZZ